MSTYAQYQFDLSGYQDVLISVDGTERRAAISLRLLREKVVVIEHYMDALKNVLKRLRASEIVKNQLLSKRTEGKKALLIVSGNKGLVGDYYNNLFAFGLENRHEYQLILCVGQKAKQYLDENDVEYEYIDHDTLNLAFMDTIFSLSQKLKERYMINLKQLDILAANPRTLAIQVPYIHQLLPLPIDIDPKINSGFPIFDSGEKEIISRLAVPLWQATLTHTLLQSRVAELSARTVAMEQAKDKTNTLLRTLRREYYKSRNLLLTQKQMESFLVHKLL